MNTNPNAYKILCYGDSNTWGYIPVTEARYPADVRWTGVLQTLLGDGYWVIEEGFNGRTTNLEDPDSPAKNGLQYFYPCLRTHNPLDLIVLMLGTNDTKFKFHRSAEEIAADAELLLQEIQQTAWNKQGETPAVLLLAPPLVDDTVMEAREEFAGAGEKTARLPSLYQQLARRYGSRFADVSGWVSPSPKDGIHLEEKAHFKMAQELYSLIKALLL